MNKRILYLGGYFQAEHSMKQSFADNGVEMLFLIDDNDYARENYWANPAYHNFSDLNLVKVVPSSLLEAFIKSYKPDVIIHRHYMYRPLMHFNSVAIASKLGIPFVHFEVELSTNPEEYQDPQQSFTDCDVFLYAHDFEIPLLKYLKENKKSCYFYPYGVSSFERSMPEIEKDREIGGFGYSRDGERSRCRNLNMFLEGIKKLGKKMHVYGPWKFSPWVDFSSLIVHTEYKWEETTGVMNRHKIAINFETLPNVEGAFSHKMFQTIGCGIPTLTYYKASVYNLFFTSNNPILIKNSNNVSYWIDFLLNEPPAWELTSEMGEKYIHERYDWYSRFSDIMKKEKIW